MWRHLDCLSLTPPHVRLCPLDSVCCTVAATQVAVGGDRPSHKELKQAARKLPVP